MSEKLVRLEGLARLTRENSEEGRRELLREVTDLFMEAPETLNETEVAYFGEIMGHMVGKVETMVRQHLSDTIASIGNAPPDVVFHLANDEIEVALPVLVHSEVLGDHELVKIVETRSQEHLKAISMRASITETVTDALVVKGNDTVLETLADNSGARFSHGGMAKMVKRAESNETLNQSLVRREDMPDDLASDMFWRVSWAMREQILGELDLGEEAVEALMKETEKWFQAQEASRKLDDAENYAIRKEKLNQLDPGLLLRLAREDRTPELVACIGRLAKLDPEMARQTVFDPTGQKMVLVMRALDMNFDMFGEMLMLTNYEGARDQDDTRDLLEIFGRIEQKVASRAMRFLRTRTGLKKKMAAGA